MHFTASTIAAAALLLSAVEAAPHHSRPHGTGNRGSFPTGRPRPSGGFPGFPSAPFPSGVFPSNGAPFPTGGFSGFPTAPGFSGIPESPSDVPGFSGIPEISGPAPTAAPSLPTGGADVSSVSFGFPSSVPSNINAADDDDDEDESTKTSAAAEPTATSGSGNSTTPTSGSSAGTAASSTFPEAAGESTLSEPMVVTGEFDGGMVRFGRGVECGGQSEGGDSDAVFQIEEGGTLKNVIIGADQSEGVHCMGACTIENVWWEAVCEDALTIKQESGTSKVVGGGAKGADDKVVQHNGGGTVSISGFYVEDFGKLYRSCGNCDTMYERHVVIDSVTADGGSATFVGINSNYGDTATITNSCVTNTKTICEEFEGNDTGDEPESISTGPSSACIYTDADISAC